MLDRKTEARLGWHKQSALASAGPDVKFIAFISSTVLESSITESDFGKMQMIENARNCFAKLTGVHRLLIFLFAVTLSATLVALLVGGLTSGIVIGVLVVALLLITRPVWQPAKKESVLNVWLNSLAIISAVALAVAGKTPQTKPLWRTLIGLLGLQTDSAQQVVSSDRLLSAFVLAFTLIGIFIVNWFARDKSAMHVHPTPIDRDFPEQTYKEQLKRFSEILSSRLVMLDEETRWDDYYYAPLAAEVEVMSGRRYVRKVVDLMRALKADRSSRIILVLGDPGAGKSIALRKLAKDLMSEVPHTGRLPVYVNLKEWATGQQWKEDSPPTAQELRAFLLRTLKSYSVFADQFLEEYFDRMFDHDRFFFLLDSFDEIPGVLDVSEGSWLIQHLSRLITEFFLSQNEGRGIVSSRFYRRPKFTRVETATFEIRPFSDIRIHEALLRGKLRSDTVDKLFRERAELIPVARNPFSAALIRLYAENHGGELPTTQLEMYESYIRNRLTAATEQGQSQGLQMDQLIANATEIAWCMFREPDIGLDAPTKKLAELLPTVPVEGVVSVFRYAGLARVSSGSEARFSFAHRRLNEYFVARRLLDDPTSVNLQAIPTDSRYRDALALYCEVGADEDVKQIARFCWFEVAKSSQQDGNLAEQLRAAHCLRFLSDAFRTRPEMIDFEAELSDYIEQRLQPEGDLLAAKIALEATGLLREQSAEPILVKAFQMRNPWISETAFHACRHLSKISFKVEEGLFFYLGSIPIREFLERNRELVFSLSLSEAFRVLRRYCMLRAIGNRVFLVATVVLSLMYPAQGIAFLLFWAAYKFLQPTREFRNRNFTRVQLALGTLVFVSSDVGFLKWVPQAIGMRSKSGLEPIFLSQVDALFSDIAKTHIWFGLSPRYAVPCCLLLTIAMLPLVDAIYKLRFIWRGHLGLKRLLTFIIVLPVFVALLLGGIKVVDLAFAFLSLYRGWLIVFLCALAITPAFTAGKLVLTLFKDRKLLRLVTQSTALSRATIACDFKRFRTRWYRMFYVEWLRDAQVSPIGDWPDTRPNVDSDGASTLLAQLDEHWLGFEA